MKRIVIAYLVTLAVFLGLDFGWLTVTTPLLYAPDIGPMMAAKPNMIAAVIFYGLFIVGLVVFAIAPGLDRGRVGGAVTRAALFGLIAYGTYDLTSLAVLRGFTVRLTIADMAWGAVVSAIAAGAGFAAAKRFG